MKKKAISQIWIPLFLTIILIIFSAIFLLHAVEGNATQRMHWADISLIYLLSSIIIILPLVFLFSLLSSHLVHIAYKGSKKILGKAQNFTSIHAEKVQSFCRHSTNLHLQPKELIKTLRSKIKHE